MDLLVRFLNELIDSQEYPVPAAKTATELYRPLGIGVIGYAHALAKRNLYSPENKEKLYEFTNEVGEALYYYSLKATTNLAKEIGSCPGYSGLMYSDGVLNIDTYEKSIDEFAKYTYKLDWSSLRKDVKKYGVRNSQLLALMPSEQSSVISNSTPGVDPVLNTISVTLNNGVNAVRVSPDYSKLKNAYKTAYTYTIDDNIDLIIKPMAILQKYVCQSISMNNYFDLSLHTSGKVEMEDLLRIFISASKYGIKTMYYSRTNVKSEDLNKSHVVDPTPIIEEAHCESCAI